MTKQLILAVLLFLVVVTLITYSVTYALFSDTAASTSNTFTASQSFPTNTPTPTPTGIANHIVISEVQNAGAKITTDEFVEIYNPTSSSINLSTLPLKLHIINSAGTDDNKTLAFINSTIPAHGFFLIGSATDYTGSANLDATYITASGNTLVSNGAVYISTSVSEDKTGLIDLVGFGTASSLDRETTALSNPAANTSVERKAYSTSTSSSMSGADATKGNGFDTNNNSTDFVTRTTPQPQNSTTGGTEIP